MDHDPSFSTKRFCAVFFPKWSILQAARKHLGRPYRPKEDILILRNEDSALISKKGSAIVAACSHEASARGVMPGMSLSLAKALLPKKSFLFPFTPEDDFLHFQRTALQAQKLSPLIAFSPGLDTALERGAWSHIKEQDWSFVLDISGTARMYDSVRHIHNESELCAFIEKRCLVAGYPVQLACAPSAASAECFACFPLPRHPQTEKLSPLEKFELPSCHPIIDKRELRIKLASLPIAALRLSSSQEKELAELGLQYLEQVFDIPRKELAVRFGFPLLDMLDALLAVHEKPRRFLHGQARFEEELFFQQGLEKQQDILFACSKLLRKLFVRLYAERLQASSFSLIFQGNDLRKQASESSFTLHKELTLAYASSDSSTLEHILLPSIERLQIPSGVFRIHILARGVGSRRAEDQEIWTHPMVHSSPKEQSQLFNTLYERLPQGAVSKLSFRNKHLPEERYTFQHFHTKLHKQTCVLEQHPAYDASHSSLAHYPSFLLSVPEKILATALLPDKAPSQIIWQKKKHKICSSRGPEKIALPWWEKSHGSDYEEREYFAVQNEEGLWLWIYRLLPQMEWFLHGIWK